MKIFYEGKFNGVRVMLPCSVASPDGYCFVDTAGSITIFRDLPAGATLKGKSNLGGIGWQTECTEAVLPELRIGNETFSNFEFTHCPGFNEFFSPMIGVNAFWGRRFDFNFSANDFSWRNEAPEGVTYPVWGTGRRNAWIGVEASLAGQNFSLIWDTGAPITLATHEFVGRFPGVFEEVFDRPLPPSLQRTGGRAYRIKAPIIVGGVSLEGEFVHAVDLKAIFGEAVADTPVILGTDHIRRANWHFDLVGNRVRVEALTRPGEVALDR
jgi:hypothetical protein